MNNISVLYSEEELALSVKKLGAEITEEYTPGRPTSEPARDVEQRHDPCLELRLYDQYQHGDELLARRAGKPVGMPATPVPDDP